MASTRRAALPAPYTEVAGALLGDRIVVVGGLAASGAAAQSAFLWDQESDRWTAGPDLPIPIHHTQVVSARDRAWVIGGFTDDGSGGWAESVATFSLGAGETAWRQEAPLPVATGALGVTSTEDGTIIAFGGVANGGVVATTHVLRPGAVAWTAGPDLAEPREHLAATTIDGRVFAIAGRVGSLESNKATVESWDPNEPDGAWRSEPSLNHARGGIDADGRCVAGGEEPAGTIGSIECLEAGGGGWVVVGELDVARHGLAAVLLGESLHTIAGGDRPGLFVTAEHEAHAVG